MRGTRSNQGADAQNEMLVTSEDERLFCSVTVPTDGSLPLKQTEASVRRRFGQLLGKVLPIFYINGT
jgi:hypothetical protein